MKAYSALAAFYDRLMQDVDYDAWADRYLAILEQGGLGKGAAVADLGCGTGQITKRLARHGFRVTGVDLSESMLGQAELSARAEALRIPYIRQDMRKLCLPRPADAVTIACDGVNYIRPDETDAFFRHIHRCIRKQGLLVFDVSTPHKLEHTLGDRLLGDDLGDLCYLWQNRFHKETGRLEMELTFFQQKENGLYARYDETQTQWAHPKERLLESLLNAGFEAEAFGGLDDKPARPDDERQLFFARKKEENPCT